MVEIFNEGAEKYAEDIAIRSLIEIYIRVYHVFCNTHLRTSLDFEFPGRGLCGDSEGEIQQLLVIEPSRAKSSRQRRSSFWLWDSISWASV
jgi:hypothetical protein